MHLLSTASGKVINLTVMTVVGAGEMSGVESN
jgi:hypothetical protein